VKRTSVLMLFAAAAATVVALSVAGTAGAHNIFCAGAACGPSSPQNVTPSFAAGNNHCPEGTAAEVDWNAADLSPAGVTKNYTVGTTSGTITVFSPISMGVGHASFQVNSGSGLVVQARTHGGNGQGGVNGTNIYDYSAKTNGGVTADGALHFSGPASNVFLCLKQGPILAVTTSTFNARYTGRSVTVRWRTASEVNVLGFNVYRVSQGKRVKLNKRLIPSANVLHGKSTSAYSFRTRLASKRLAASSRYLLQEVHTNGSRTNYGPIRARNAA
jgi:hypothetical protein